VGHSPERGEMKTTMNRSNWYIIKGDKWYIHRHIFYLLYTVICQYALYLSPPLREYSPHLGIILRGYIIIMYARFWYDEDDIWSALFLIGHTTLGLLIITEALLNIYYINYPITYYFPNM
jgi:hypothetical protein